MYHFYIDFYEDVKRNGEQSIIKMTLFPKDTKKTLPSGLYSMFMRKKDSSYRKLLLLYATEIALVKNKPPGQNSQP